MRLSFILTLLATTVASTPIYQPAFHGPLPGQEHEFNLQHVKHIDDKGRVTYIHDSRDHRPDFCSMPGEEELCRQQIEAANNAPAVYDDGHETITLTGPHKDDELAPGHDSSVHELNPLDVTQQQQSDIHAGDTTITLDNGNVITIHSENGHVRNINDGNINLEGPPTEGGHVPNIKPQQGQSVHKETIKQDTPDVTNIPNIPHQRNINDGNINVEGPPADGGHVPNIKPQQGQSTHKETIKQDNPDVNTVPNVPHQRNVNDNPNPLDGPASEGGHVRNINNGQSVPEKPQSETTPTDAPQSPFPGAFGPHTIASHPMNKLQEAIRKQSIQA